MQGIELVLLGIVLVLAGGALGLVGLLTGFKAAYIFSACLAAIGLLKIATMPDHKKTVIAHGGDKCPNCGTQNELRWND